MQILKSRSAACTRLLATLDDRIPFGPSAVERSVFGILSAVKANGDEAVLDYTKEFDQVSYTERTMKVSPREIAAAKDAISPAVLKSLKTAVKRITRFHKKQVETSWNIKEAGATLGQIIRPLAAVGIYVPGGKAAYPSSVLMNALPAKIAGVKRIVMTTPTPAGKMNPTVLVAADLAGVDEIYKIGGAQAVGALAFGTKTIKPVDKIVGPGNIYVAEAKRQLFGRVGIDMIAGPSEILIIADDNADPALVTADLLSQAEHDENALPMLVTPSATLAKKVATELKTQSRLLNRTAIVEACLAKNCYGIVTKSLDEAFDIANRIGPEHLELMLTDAEKYVDKVENVGAIFVGAWTPEALGDYMAGPNHVLPTSGSTRFFSPLGVYDFLKRTSLLHFTEKGLQALADDVTILAREERLDAHAAAVDIRRGRNS